MTNVERVLVGMDGTVWVLMFLTCMLDVARVVVGMKPMELRG